MIDAYDTDESNHLYSETRAISELEQFRYFLLESEVKPFNIGVDLPIYFGNPLSNNRIIIVAIDPKRTGQKSGVYSLGSVFGLHTKEGRSTKKNKYWNFIKPMITNNFFI